MPAAPATGQPARVIYAKLTSTGAYDVVARTSGLTLDLARTFAERLLPGNPPLDASVGEEVAHVRPPEGGHVVLRFARYDWADGDRGDVYITDIAWYSADDFARARCNVFALVPRTDQVFDEATELPAFSVPSVDVDAEHSRIAELHATVAADARTVIASAAAADPVLLIHSGARADAMELFTLLLPPRLRAALTFQTQAFRVPAVLPRVTLVDRGYANLREASWKVLPSLDVAVPMELAGRFVALAADCAALAVAHALYEQTFDDGPDMRNGISRVVSLAEVAVLLRDGDAGAVLRAVTGLDARIRAAVLQRLRAAAGEDAVRAALVDLSRHSDDGARHALALLREVGDVPPATVAALVDGLRAGAPEELLVDLTNRCARAGDVPRLVQLIALDRRTITTRMDVEHAAVQPDVRHLVAALRSGSAADLLAAAAEVQPAVRGSAAADALHRMCRDSVGDALERVHTNPPAVDGVLRLADAADAYVAAVAPSSPLPPVMARYELAQPDAAERAAAAHDAAARAVLGAAMLVRACDAHAVHDTTAAQQYARSAVVLLTAGGQQGRELARQVLHHRGVQEHDLVALPGSEALLPLLGGNAQQAALTRRIVSAIQGVAGGNDAAVQDLAGAVLAAFGQHVRITSGSELSQNVLAALRTLPGAAPAAASQSRSKRAASRAPAVKPSSAVAPAATDVCLELLGLITDPAHLADLEDAALGDCMSARLQRLDRSIALCRAVEREDRYERYADAIESSDVPLNEAARERLRDALGTRGLQRRLLRAVSSVVEREAR